MSQQVIDVLSSDEEECLEPPLKKSKTTSLIRPHVTLTRISNNKNKDQKEDAVMVVSDDEHDTKSVPQLKKGPLISSKEDLIILSDDENEKCNGNGKQVIDILECATDVNTLPEKNKPRKEASGVIDIDTIGKVDISCVQEILELEPEKQIDTDMGLTGMARIEIVLEDAPVVANEVPNSNSIIKETNGNLEIDLYHENQDCLPDRKVDSSDFCSNEINRNPDYSELNKISSDQAIDGVQDHVSIPLEELGSLNKLNEIDECSNSTALMDATCADQNVVSDNPSSETNETKKDADNLQLNKISNNATNVHQVSVPLSQEKLEVPDETKDIYKSDDVTILTDTNCTDQKNLLDDPSSETNILDKTPDNSQLNEIRNIANNALQDPISLSQESVGTPQELTEIDQGDNVTTLMGINCTNQNNVLNVPGSEANKTNENPDISQLPSSETNKTNENSDISQLNEIDKNINNALQDAASLSQEKFEISNALNEIDGSNGKLMEINSADQSNAIDDDVNAIQDVVSTSQEKLGTPNEPNEIGESSNIKLMELNVADEGNVINDDTSAVHDHIMTSQKSLESPNEPTEIIDESNEATILKDTNCTDQSIVIDDLSSEIIKPNESSDNSQLKQIGNNDNNALEEFVSLSQEKVGTLREPKEIDKPNDVTMLMDINCSDQSIVINDSAQEANEINEISSPLSECLSNPNELEEIIETDDVIMLPNIDYSESIVIDDSDPETDKSKKSFHKSESIKKDNPPDNNGQNYVSLRSTEQSPTIETTSELNESPIMLVDKNVEGSIIINDSDEESDIENVEIFDVNVQETSVGEVCAASLSFKVEPAFKEFVSLVEEKLINSPFEELLPKKVPVLQKYFKRCVDYTEKHYFRVLLKDNIEYIRRAKESKAAERAVRAFHKIYTYLKASVEEIVIEIEEEDLPKVKKLEKAMKILRKRIKELEEQEVDLSDDEDSAYIMLDRYRERFNKIHEKYCQYIKKNPYLGRATYDKIAFVNSDYNVINQAISKEYKNSLRFPTYYELQKLIEKVNKEEHLDMSEAEIKKESVDCFKNLGALLQKKRRLELYDIHSEYVEYTEDPAIKNPSLEKILKRNNSEGKIKIKEVIEEFAEKQEQLEENSLSEEESVTSTASDLNTISTEPSEERISLNSQEVDSSESSSTNTIDPEDPSCSKEKNHKSDRKDEEDCDIDVLSSSREKDDSKTKLELKTGQEHNSNLEENSISFKKTVIDEEPSRSEETEKPTEEDVVQINKAELQLEKGEEHKNNSASDPTENNVDDGDANCSKEEEKASSQ